MLEKNSKLYTKKLFRLVDLRLVANGLMKPQFDGQKPLQLIFSGIPTHLFQAQALPVWRKCTRHRGKRGGLLVRLKA